jgi:hypothetical protein
MTRPKPDLRLERALWESGYRYVAGIDEAGRGALAGPVAAKMLRELMSRSVAKAPATETPNLAGQLSQATFT